MEIPEYDQEPTIEDRMAEYEAQREADGARLESQRQDARIAKGVHDLIQLADHAATSPAAFQELRRVMGAMFSGTARAR